MAAKVLDTYELLEDILLHLPLRQLLLAQRVNKQFHAVIQDSLKINQVLFFKPATTTTVEWWPTAQIGRRIGSFTVSECIWTSKGEKSEQVVIVNPLSHMKAFSPKKRPKCTMCVINPSPKTKPDQAVKLRVGKDVEHEAMYSYDFQYTTKHEAKVPSKHDPSLARMFISDPPIAELRLLWTNPPPHETSSSSSLSRAEGIRFRELWSHYMRGTRAGKKGKKVSRFEAIGSFGWFAVESDVDSLTGWEMLELLRTSQEERKEGWELKSAKVL